MVLAAEVLAVVVVVVVAVVVVVVVTAVVVVMRGVVVEHQSGSTAAVKAAGGSPSDPLQPQQLTFPSTCRPQDAADLAMQHTHTHTHTQVPRNRESGRACSGHICCAMVGNMIGNHNRPSPPPRPAQLAAHTHPASMCIHRFVAGTAVWDL